MDRPTKIVAVTAGVLCCVGGGLALARYSVLGGDLSGMMQGARWQVVMRVTCYARRPAAYVKLLVPPKSDAQQISGEEFHERGMTRHQSIEPLERNRVIEWRAAGTTGAKDMSVSFYAQTLPEKEPSPRIGKKELEEKVEYYLQATDKIQSSAPLIQQTAQRLVGHLTRTEDKIDAIYRYCAFQIVNSVVPGTVDAMTCLTNGYSDCGGKSRLMVALLRASGIPARVVGGLILTEGVKRDTHVWVEAWDGERWHSYCPLNRHYRTQPANYLLLYRGDYPLLRHRYMDQVVYDFTLRRIAAHQLIERGETNRWREIAAAATLARLSPNSQWAVKFLLLIPLGALVVCVMRNIVGVPTLGTFAPVLISLGIHLAPLRWGIITLVGFLVIGLLVRYVVEWMKLLLVPRLSVMLTVVIMGMVAMVAFTDQFENELGTVVGLLPVVILTMAIERCWLLELEDGTVNMLKHVLGTLLSVVVICVIFRMRFIVNSLFALPELVLVLLAMMLVIGRYMGFRLSELLRFRAIVHEQRR
ncbi:MAG: hypothetical protein N2595_00700 [bacterium]|nr:hypothetical protein [bacterium]